MLQPHQPHRLEPVHAGHENIEEQQVEVAAKQLIEAAAAVAGGDHLMADPLQQQPHGGLNRRVVINDENFRQGRLAPVRMESRQRQVA